MAKYLRQDSELGYVENSAEIEYLKLNNLRHSILGFMLGDFDEQGFYNIEPEIQKELISMRKFVVNSTENIDICHGAIMLADPITFMVTFESDRATLSLVEKLSFEANLELNSGTYSNVNEFILDEVETAGEIDRNLVYKRWNIGEFGGDVLDFSHMDEATLAIYFGLVNRYKYLLVANTALLDQEAELEDVEAEYTTAMLEVLTRYPALKKLVDEEVKTDITEKTEFLRLDKPNFSKTFNEILDQAIENNQQVLNGSDLTLFNQEKIGAKQTRNIKMQNALDVKTEFTTEEESNQVDMAEFAVRSNKKLVLGVPYSSYSLDEAEQNFIDASNSAEDRLRKEAVSIVGKSKNSQASSEKEKTLRYIDDITGLKPKEFTGEDVQAEVKEVKEEKSTKTEAQTNSTAEVNNGKKQENGRNNNASPAGRRAQSTPANKNKNGTKVTKQDKKETKKEEKKDGLIGRRFGSEEYTSYEDPNAKTTNTPATANSAAPTTNSAPTANSGRQSRRGRTVADSNEFSLNVNMQDADVFSVESEIAGKLNLVAQAAEKKDEENVAKGLNPDEKGSGLLL